MCFALRPPDTSDHELRGAAGGPGVRPGKGAVPGAEPGHPVRVHRRHRGAAARRHPEVLALPRALRQAGRAALQRESGEEPGVSPGVVMVTRTGMVISDYNY